METTPEKQHAADTRCRKRPLFSHDESTVHHVVFQKPEVSIPGPRNHDERFEWPHRQWKRYSSAERDRLIRNMTRLRFCTRFTGAVNAQQTIFYMIITFLNTLLADKIECPREIQACEKEPLRRKVLLEL